MGCTVIMLSTGISSELFTSSAVVEGLKREVEGVDYVLDREDPEYLPGLGDHGEVPEVPVLHEHGGVQDALLGGDATVCLENSHQMSEVFSGILPSTPLRVLS